MATAAHRRDGADGRVSSSFGTRDDAFCAQHGLAPSGRAGAEPEHIVHPDAVPGRQRFCSGRRIRTGMLSGRLRSVRLGARSGPGAVVLDVEVD